MAQQAAKAKKEKKVKLAIHGPMDVTFFILVLVLLAFGLVMLFSASYASAFYRNNDSFYYISKQLVFAVAGVAAMIIISHIDYHIFHRLAFPILILSIILLVIVLFMPELNNAKRWILIDITSGFTLNFQPSEIAKFAVVIMFAQLISINYKEMKTFKQGVLPFAIILAIVCGLMLLEPHLSGTILILLLGALMMFVGGTSLKWFGMVAAAMVAAVAVAIMIPGFITYAQGRIEMWLNPYIDPLGDGFQTIQSLLAIGSGGLMGLGLGQSRQKYLYIPEPQNDFVFAIVCEELGFIGAVLIILLFVLLVWRGYVIAMRCKDKFGSLIAMGLVSQVGIQALLNIAVVTNTIPNTGISLPFFSYGGTSLMMLLAQMGVVLSVSRNAVIEKK